MPGLLDAQYSSDLDHLDRERLYRDSVFGRLATLLERGHAAMPHQGSQQPSGVTGFLADMGMEGLKTANRWLGSPMFPEQVTTGDVLAPTGAGFMVGAATGLPRNAVGAAGSRLGRNIVDDMPQQAALRIGDRVFSGPIHAIAQEEAERALGKAAVDAAWSRQAGFGDNEGFITSAGRYVTRKEAHDILAAKDAAAKLNIPGFEDELHSSALLEVQRAKPDLFADTTRASLPGLIANAAETDPQASDIRNLLLRYGLLQGEPQT